MIVVKIYLIRLLEQIIINRKSMPKPKKIPTSQLSELSAHSEITSDHIDIADDNISTNQNSRRMNVENPKLEKPKVDFTLNGCQSIFLIFLTCILLVFLIVFASIALRSTLEEKSQKQDIISQSTKASQVSKEKEELKDEIKKQSDQISTLNNKIGDLEIQLIKLQKVLQKQNNLHQQKSNKTESSTQIKGQNKTSKQNEISNNTELSNQTQAQNSTGSSNQTSPMNQHQKLNQTEPSNQTQSISKNESSTITEELGEKNQTKPMKDESTQKPEGPKYRIRSQPRSNITGGGPRDLYEFTVSIENVVANSPINSMFHSPDSEWNGLNKTAFQRSLRLIEVVHNVNFKGQFVFDHHKFYNSPEDKYNALSKILKQEKQYYDQKYQINQYIHDQIGICVFIPSYNNVNHRLYLRNLDSLFQQQYQNYHLVYVNDASTDGTGDYVKSYMEENQIPKEKYVIINNEVNKKNCANTYMVIHQYCNPGQIFVMLDGDDALIGRQVFSFLNAIYQKEKVALTYGQFLLVRENHISNGFSRDIPVQYLEQGTFRQLKSFFSSHLKTMYVDVMRKIKQEDLQYPNGTFYDYAPDVTYMTPSIEMVGPRLKFVKELLYEYRFDTGANEPHQKQIVVEMQVYTKPAYQKLQSMPFADEPKTVHYP